MELPDYDPTKQGLKHKFRDKNLIIKYFQTTIQQNKD